MKIELYKIQQISSLNFCYYLVIDDKIKYWKIDGSDEWKRTGFDNMNGNFKTMAIKVKDLTEGELLLELL